VVLKLYQINKASLKFSWQLLSFFFQPVGLPVGHAGFVECHKVDLTRGTALRRREEHLVVSLAQELEFLSLLMHKDAVEVTSFHVPDLDCFVAPAHNLPRAYEGHRGGHLAPLQHNVLRHLSVGVYVNAFVIVTEKQLHAL